MYALILPILARSAGSLKPFVSQIPNAILGVNFVEASYEFIVQFNYVVPETFPVNIKEDTLVAPRPTSTSNLQIKQINVNETMTKEHADPRAECWAVREAETRNVDFIGKKSIIVKK